MLRKRLAVPAAVGGVLAGDNEWLLGWELEMVVLDEWLRRGGGVGYVGGSVILESQCNGRCGMGGSKLSQTGMIISEKHHMFM